MNVKPTDEHNLEFLSLKGSYTGSSKSTLVKMPHCWKITCHSSNMLKPIVPHREISTLLQFETNGPAHDGLLLKTSLRKPLIQLHKRITFLTYVLK